MVVPTSPASPDPIFTLFSKLFAGGSSKQIFFGVFQRSVDPSSIPSEEAREALRTAAATELTNIDAAERQRRLYAGAAFSALTALLGWYLLASHAAPLTRAAVAPPIFLSYGYIASWRTGL